MHVYVVFNYVLDIYCLLTSQITTNFDACHEFQ